jgi:hypothetical protein
MSHRPGSVFLYNGGILFQNFADSWNILLEAQNFYQSSDMGSSVKCAADAERVKE